MFANVVTSYRPRAFYYRRVFHRSDDPAQVCWYAKLLSREADRVVRFAREVEVPVPEDFPEHVCEDQELFSPEKPMGKVRRTALWLVDPPREAQ